METIREIEALTVDVLVDNTTDLLSSRPDHVHSELRVLMEAGMGVLEGQALCSGHHGLALLVTARDGDETATVLFDAGPDPYAIERNGTRMGVDFGAIQAIIVSHGHFDHTEGLGRALELVRQANGDREVPLYIHPDAFVERGVTLPSGVVLPLQSVPTAEALERAGAQVELSREPQEILDGFFYVSGAAPRETPFERGFPGHMKRVDGHWEDDPWIMDERFLVARVRGKGLVVLTGCSHAGIVNTLVHARAVFGDVPLHAVIGGLHLAGGNEEVIPETVAALRDLAPRHIIAGHCTGWRAIHALVDAFGEAIVDPLAVGSRHLL